MSQVVHTIGSLGSDKGGPSRTVPRLCAELSGDGRWQARLLCTDRPSADLPAVKAAGAAAEQTGGGLGFWKALKAALNPAGRQRLLVHDHGLWLSNNAMAGLLALKRQLPLVVSPRGMLHREAMDHRAWKKRFAMVAYQAALLRRASAFHATSDAELARLRQLGFWQPVVVLPNGVELPAERVQDRGPRARRQALFLSRIHPHKGVLELLEAWATVRPSGWCLTLVGPGEPSFRHEVVDRIAQMPLGVAVELRDAVDDSEKWALYRDADLVVLPSRSENFGVVVAEALASAVPVLTTTGTPWSELPKRGCGWHVSPNAASLADALREAVAIDETGLRTMGELGRAWMRSDYSWKGLGRQLADAYDWLAAGQPRDNVPVCVHLP